MAIIGQSLIKIYELVLLVTCTSCFFYQLYILCGEYLSGRTVINIEINQDHYDTLPAITICPAGLALDKVALLNDQLKTIYDKYINDSDLPGKETYDKMEEILMKMVDDGEFNLRVMSSIISPTMTIRIKQMLKYSLDKWQKRIVK